MGKILIVHHSGIIGGAGVSLMNTVKLLAPTNDVTVAVSNDPDDILKKLNELKNSFNFNVISYGRRIGALTYYSGGDRMCSPRFSYRFLLIFRQWRYWNRLVRQLNPDIIVLNSIILSWMSLLPEIKKRASICFVRETINGKVTDFANQIIRHLLFRFRKTVFLSIYDRESWNYPDEKSDIIRNYVEPEYLDTSISRAKASSAFNLRKESFHLLYVGGVSHMKGFDIAVKAVMECKSDVELIVAGVDFNDRCKMGGGHLTEYENQMSLFIKQCDTKNRVHMIGRQMNMSNCYSAADTVVFPMREPHQARPAFEAGWYGIPIIITDFENIRESVVDGVNGLLVKPDDSTELSAKIDYLALHPEFKKEIGARNKNHTLHYHNKDNNNKQLLKLIESIK